MHVLAQVNSPVRIKGIIAEAATGKPLSNVTITISNPEKNFAHNKISDANGLFAFTIPVKSGTLQLNFSMAGYKNFDTSLLIKAGDTATHILAIKMTEAVQQLDSVMIKTKNLIYKNGIFTWYVKPKNFLPGADAREVLRQAPLVSLDDNFSARIKGHISADIFINGSPAATAELKTLQVNDILKIEVLTSPPPQYGTDIKGGIINIITKKRKADSFKGFAGADAGIINNLNFENFGISCKTRKLLVNTGINRLYNVQPGYSVLQRSAGENFYSLYQEKKSALLQTAAFADVFADIDSATTMQIRNSYSAMKDNTASAGSYQQALFISDTARHFYNAYSNNPRMYNLDIQLKKILANENYFVFSLRYTNKETIKENILTSMQTSGNTTARNTDTSYFTEINPNFLCTLNLDKLDGSVNFGSSFFMRHNRSRPAFFSYDSSSHQYIKYSDSAAGINFNQQLAAFFGEAGIDIKNYSFAAGFRNEITINTGDLHGKNYFNFLPYFSVNINKDSAGDLEFTFTKKIKRPGLFFLNPFIYPASPLTANQGNSELSAEKITNIDLSYNKPLKNDHNLNLSAFCYKTKNRISSIIITDSLQNFLSGFSNQTQELELGISISTDFTLFKKISCNFNGFIEQNNFSGQGEFSSISNKKLVLGSTIDASYIFLKKYNISLYTDYTSRDMELQTTYRLHPYTSLSLGSNFLKDKLNAKIIWRDIANNSGNSKSWFKSGSFSETNLYTNHLNNLILSLQYNFGGSFDTYRRKTKFQTNDLKNSK